MTRLSGSESDDASAGITTDSEQGVSGATAVAVSRHNADLREYGKTLCVDVDNDDDLVWLVQEAFVAELPQSWTEHLNEDGRVYFYNQLTQVSSWSHPMDSVFRELVRLVKELRAEQQIASQTKELEALEAHLQVVRERAMADLDGWSGPYASEEGPYYYNAALGASVWKNPVDEWQVELELRERVLRRCFCTNRSTPAPIATKTAVLEHPLLGLATANPEDSVPLPQSPNSARSFASARSNITAQSLTPTRSRQSLIGHSCLPLLPQPSEQQQQQQQATQEQQQTRRQRLPEQGGSQFRESVSPVGAAGGSPRVSKAAADDRDKSDSPQEFTFAKTSPVTMPKLDE
mmetsp:Transcript_76877/g.148525  ORF Transcript_76877/g.148525 Transcript_76877/m.148525 type:complete len:347 (+) Transcript_76877:127-1167(+)